MKLKKNVFKKKLKEEEKSVVGVVRIEMKIYKIKRHKKGRNKKHA